MGAYNQGIDFYLRRYLNDPLTAIGENDTPGEEQMPANFNQLTEEFNLTDTFPQNITLGSPATLTGLTMLVSLNGISLIAGTHFTLDNTGQVITLLNTNIMDGENFTQGDVVYVSNVVKVIYWVAN